MGLLALILSVVIDAIWPLRSRPQEWLPDEEGSAAALDDFAADPFVETPYDPLVDAAATAQTSTRPAAQAAAAAGSAAARSQVAYVPHPLERHALRLIDAVAGGSDPPGSVHSAPAVPASVLPAESRHLSLPGWLAVVGLPVVLVVLAEAVLDALGGFFVFLLHVALLYLTVGLGAFHRRFSELQLLIGAGEARSARLVLARWIAASGGAGPAGAARAEMVLDDTAGLQDATGTGTGIGIGTGTGIGATPGVAADSAMPLAGLATAQVVLAAFRDVFAPLFWYAVLPGATGPVLYLFARFAACHSFPFAGTAYQLLDWIPLRLAALGFALVG
ncbi:MAG: hypothetical protein H0T52_12290, partial [Lautropia sp.]|nr:hypothetical protein [Lautropia sp.]